MKKIFLLGFAILFILGFSSCGKQQQKTPADSEAMEKQDADSGNESHDITLTQELIDKYIQTLPPFVKKAKELGESVNAMAMTFSAGGEMESLLKSHGWSKPEEFFDVHGKIWVLMPWLMMANQMKGQSKEMQKQIMDQYKDLFDSHDITEAEEQLLIKNQEKLFAAMEAASK